MKLIQAILFKLVKLFSGHYTRIHVAIESIIFGGFPTFVYSNVKNDLKITKLSELILRFPLTARIKQALFLKYSKKEDRAYFLKSHILKTKNELEKHFPNLDFVVFVYSYNDEILLITDELRKNNIKVLYFEELTKRQDTAGDLIFSDGHPNAKAWSIVTPKLWDYIENYNLEKEQNTIAFEKSKQIDLHNFSPPLKDALFMREGSGGLRFQDERLIFEKKITKAQACCAYILWAVANFLENLHLKTIPKILVKSAIKINKENDLYQGYYELKFSKKQNNFKP